MLELKPARADGMSLAVLLAGILWTVFVGTLAVARHDSLRTNAFDLGYVTNTLWHTAHGAPFRMTTLEGATFAPDGLDIGRLRQPHSLLAFHVEPVLLLLAPVSGLWPDPRVLLWLQASLLGAGALPAAWLGRAVCGGRIAGPAFGVAYLLAPGLEGAALSDFHAVALAAPCLMTGLYLVETGRPRGALVFLILAALCREDAALLVAWLGLVLAGRAWLRRRLAGSAPVRPYLYLAIGSGAWGALSLLVVMPYFSRGGALFAERYTWLLGGSTPFPVDQAGAYILLQVLTGGLLGLLAPLELAAAAPILLMNSLSGFDWMRSGGAHYSAILVPVLLWAGARGAARFAVSPATAHFLTTRTLHTWTSRTAPLVVLAALIGAHGWAGRSPLRSDFAWPVPDARAVAVRRALTIIPPEASVSASSALYPHLAARASAGWFPAGADADWIAVDLAGITHPLSPGETAAALRNLLARGEHAIVHAGDGLVLLRRGAGTAVLLEDDVVAFARAPDIGGEPLARFGADLELVEVHLRRLPEVGLFGDAGTLETRWRARAPLDDVVFALVTTRRPDGAIVGFHPDAAPIAHWYPTHRWRTGEIVRLEMSVARMAGLQALGVAVLDRRGARLPIELLPAGAGLSSWAEGTALGLLRL